MNPQLDVNAVETATPTLFVTFRLEALFLSLTAIPFIAPEICLGGGFPLSAGVAWSLQVLFRGVLFNAAPHTSAFSSICSRQYDTCKDEKQTSGTETQPTLPTGFTLQTLFIQDQCYDRKKKPPMPLWLILFRFAVFIQNAKW